MFSFVSCRVMRAEGYEPSIEGPRLGASARPTVECLPKSALGSSPSNPGEDRHHHGVGMLLTCLVSWHVYDQVNSDQRTYVATYVRAQSHRGDSGGDQVTR